MCTKACTRLRVFACFLTYMGLTIAVVGLLRAKEMIAPNWFWAWNFVAEALAVIALCLTIVSVGSGFYPMARNRNLYWCLSMAVIALYTLICLVTSGYYIKQKLQFHPISSDEVSDLRAKIINEGIYSRERLTKVIGREQRWGKIPADTLPGVSNWMALSRPEREMFARPRTDFYLAHQFAMLATCGWVCFYLFVPLVSHHRRGPASRLIDSDMMAIGVWYMTCLLILATIYLTWNIFFCVKKNFLFQDKAQALDLCIRITIGPIFFIPAPKSLLRFYRDRFRKFNGGSSAGRNDSAGRNRGSERNCFGSFNNNSLHDSLSMSPNSTRVGSGLDTRNDSVPRGSLDINADNNIHRLQEPKSPTEAYSRVKLFSPRDRGHSVESSRVLSKDFECESANSHHNSEDRPDSYHQFYSGLDSNKHSLRNPMILYEDNKQMIDKPCEVNAPQQPKPVLMEQHMRAARNNSASSKSDIELAPMSSIHGLFCKAGDEGSSLSDRQTGSAEEQPVNNSTTSEAVGFDSNEPRLAFSSTSTESEQIPINKTTAKHTLSEIDTPIEGLTGLQRQLAEYRSALLPKAIALKAYHENLATAEPFDHTFQPSSTDSSDPTGSRRTINGTRRSTNGSRPSKALLRRRTEDNPILDFFPSGISSQSDDFESESRSSSHIADSMHQSVAPVSPRYLPEVSSIYDENNTDNNTAINRLRDSKTKDGFMTAFSKALTYNGNSSNSHVDGTMETKQSPVAATIEELAQCSVMERERADIYLANSFGYSDPYSSRTEFKRSENSSTSVNLKSSSPSLTSSKSRDSLSKSSISSKETQKGPKIPGQKSFSRKMRSKSDGTQQESPQAPRAPLMELPNVFAHPALPSPIPELPAIPSPTVKASLSPPPRQSWQRSKSTKTTVPIIAAHDASQAIESDRTAEGFMSSASGASSSSPLQNFPTNIVAGLEEVHSQKAVSPSFQSQGYRGNSIEYNNDSRTSREHERTTPLSPSSSGASPRLNAGRHQRSVDNLASAYHYKRAVELNGASNRSSTNQYSQGGSPAQSPSRQIREVNGIAIPSSLHSSAMSPSLGSPPSSNINTRSMNGAHGYVDSYDGRTSSSPTQYGRGRSSPSMAMAEVHHQHSPSFNDISTSDLRSNSLTNSYISQSQHTHTQSQLLADDPWTQALVNRAQAQSSSKSSKD
ncbi:hypothetical protein BGX27_002428 [Mortierella sp. AM989]|nr:hypothetical protein BGX27_002428 [Mortierella sp. AM989]